MTIVVAVESREAPKPLSGRANVLVVVLLVSIAIEAWVVLADLQYLDVTGRILDRENVSLSEISSAEDTVDASAVAQILLSALAPAVAFLFWFARAYYNLPRLGVQGLRYKRGWSIGAWFIPIFNLFRPKQIANDVWRGSDAAADGQTGPGWRDRPVPALLHWWWAAWVAANLLGNVVGRILFSNLENPVTRKEAFDALEDEQLAYQLDIVTSVVSVIAAILVVLVIRRISERQKEAIQAAG